jgi:hypothetical protein
MFAAAASARLTAMGTTPEGSRMANWAAEATAVAARTGQAERLLFSSFFLFFLSSYFSGFDPSSSLLLIISISFLFFIFLSA